MKIPIPEMMTGNVYRETIGVGEVTIYICMIFRKLKTGLFLKTLLMEFLSITHVPFCCPFLSFLSSPKIT